jgi:hypothetical protein
MATLKEAHMTAIGSTKTSPRRRSVLAAAMAMIGLAGAANACAYAPTDPVELKVVDRQTGQALRLWRHDGRLFVAGRPGARYSLRVTNRTEGRVLVVMSVDGVNILTGETASYDQRGYVFDAHESYDVSGWRKSDTEVAAFAFAPLPQSYAARTGRPGDVGVIGMAVFKEKAAEPVVAQAPEPEPPPTQPDWRDEAGHDSSRAAEARGAAPPPPPLAMAPAPRPPAAASASAAGVFAQQRDEKLGTAHGAREWSEVTQTAFERATSYPQAVQQIEYDTYANLVASGVIPRWRGEEPRPRPFPSQPDGAGYVPDPPEGS